MHAHVHLTSSGLVRTGPGALASVLLTAGADAATVTIHDSADASGTVICVLKAGIGQTVSWSPGWPIAASNLYAAITGTTPDVTVVYL